MGSSFVVCTEGLVRGVWPRLLRTDALLKDIITATYMGLCSQFLSSNFEA